MLRDLGRDNRLLMLALFIWALGEGLWFNLRQLYLVELGAKPEQIGLALALEGVSRALLLFPVGYATDRFGAHRLMVLSWPLGLVGALVAALAHTWPGAAAGLVIYALSYFAMPTLSTYALASLPNKGKPGLIDGALTVIFASYSAGTVISPPLGGLLADAHGIRTCLYVAVGLFTISTIIVLFTRYIPPAVAPHQHQPLALFRNRNLARLAFYYMLVMFAMTLGLQLAPNFLQDVRGFSRADIGLLFALSSAGTVVINLVLGRVSSRWNVAAGLTIFWLALLGVWQMRSLAGAALSFFALGGWLSVRVLALGGVARAAGEHNRGLALSLVDMLIALSMAAAAQLAGSLYTLTPGHELPLVIGLAAVLAALALWLVARTWQDPLAESLEAQPSPLPGD